MKKCIKKDFFPKISVVVCCYNSNLLKIEATIKSIVRQKNVDFEIIIADDGSEDNHCSQIHSFLMSFSGLHFFEIYSEKNQGTIKNLLNSLPFCNGEIIKPIGPGDFLYDETCLLKASLVFAKNSDVGIVYGKTASFDNDGRILRRSPPTDKFSFFSKKIFVRNVGIYHDNLCGASLFYRKTVFLSSLLFLSDFALLTEDLSLPLLVLNGGKVASMKGYSVWYESGTGVTGARANPLRNRVIKDEDLFFEKMGESGEPSKIKSSLFYAAFHIPKKITKFHACLKISPSCIFYFIGRKISFLFAFRPRKNRMFIEVREDYSKI
jgi:glycosyltransferase involved in cell wall biosynthesis